MPALSISLDAKRELSWEIILRRPERIGVMKRTPIRSGFPLKLGDLPKHVTAEITQRLKHYCTMLIGLNDLASPEEFSYCGSGTMVAAGGHGYVLTAAHVWLKLLNFPSVGLALTEYESRFAIPTNLIHPTLLWRGKPSPWGPDLAFLRLPAGVRARIESHKTFLNLPKVRAAMLRTNPQVAEGVWALMGAPAEACVFGVESAEFHAGPYLSGIDRTHQRGGYDFLDFGVDLSRQSQAPSSLGGMSGGGLWHIKLARTIQGGARRWKYSTSLEGVAFYQSRVHKNRRVARCHGRRSLYGRGLEALGFT